VQHDLDDLGIAKTARQEKQRARAVKMKLSDQENARMAKLYRQHILQEQSEPDAPIVQLKGLSKAKPESTGVAGD
jgi:hypothetical protein